MESAKIFHIKVLQNKDPKIHPDVTLPQVSVNADLQGNKGKYFHVSVNAPMITKNGVPIPQQTRRIAFTIFESGNRSEIFKLIEETLMDKANIDVATNGSFAKIHSSVMGFEGDLRSEEVPFWYTMVGADNKPIINPNTKKPQVRNRISAFIFATEADSGLDEAIMMSEERNARKHELVGYDETGGASKTEETTV